MAVRDMVWLWLQKTTSFIPLAAHAFKNCTGFLLRTLMYQEFSLRLGMSSQISTEIDNLALLTTRASFLWQISLSC